MCTRPVRFNFKGAHASVSPQDRGSETGHAVGCDGYSFILVCWLWLGQMRSLPFLLRCAL